MACTRAVRNRTAQAAPRLTSPLSTSHGTGAVGSCRMSARATTSASVNPEVQAGAGGLHRGSSDPREPDLLPSGNAQFVNRAPGLRADDAIDGQLFPALEFDHRLFRLSAEGPVDRDAQQALNPFDR